TLKMVVERAFLCAYASALTRPRLRVAFGVVLRLLGAQTAVRLLHADAPAGEIGEDLAAHLAVGGGTLLVALEAQRPQPIGQTRLPRRVRDAEHVLDVLDHATTAQEDLDELQLRHVQPRQPPKALHASRGRRADLARLERPFERAATGSTGQARHHQRL